MADAAMGPFMNRRDASKLIGAGLLGVAAASAPAGAGAAPAAPIAARDRKKWARQHLKGMEAFILPSFAPGLQGLDEEGVRNDVRHGIRQGFGALYAVGIGVSAPESRRFLEVVAEEARDKVIVGGISNGGASHEGMVAALQHAEAAGVSEIFLPFNAALESEDAVYEATKSIITATNLGIVLYAKPTAAFRKFHPTGLPMQALDRLIDLPNVIAVKLTQVVDLMTAFQVAELVGDRALLGVVNLESAPLFARTHSIQWSGEWAVDAVQSPEKPYAVEFIDHLSRRRFAEAAKVYWAMQPALDAFFKLQGPVLAVGGHPWAHIKYYKWLTGGNGGLLRDLKQGPEHVPTLDAKARQTCRDALTRAGIKCVDLPDEAFVVGNAAYARGARMKDVAGTPHYAA